MRERSARWHSTPGFNVLTMKAIRELNQVLQKKKTYCCHCRVTKIRIATERTRNKNPTFHHPYRLTST